MRHACMGGVVALAAKVAGVAGVIIDGLACDFAEFVQYDLPVWCRGEAALTGKSLAMDGAINVPVGATLSGSVAFASVGTTGWPCSVDLNVSVKLPPGENVPASDRLTAGGVAAPCER